MVVVGPRVLRLGATQQGTDRNTGADSNQLLGAYLIVKYEVLFLLGLNIRLYSLHYGTGGEFNPFISSAISIPEGRPYLLSLSVGVTLMLMGLGGMVITSLGLNMSHVVMVVVGLEMMVYSLIHGAEGKFYSYREWSFRFPEGSLYGLLFLLGAWAVLVGLLRLIISIRISLRSLLPTGYEMLYLTFLLLLYIWYGLEAYNRQGSLVNGVYGVDIADVLDGLRYVGPEYAYLTMMYVLVRWVRGQRVPAEEVRAIVAVFVAHNVCLTLLMVYFT